MQFRQRRAVLCDPLCRLGCSVALAPLLSCSVTMLVGGGVGGAVWFLPPGWNVGGAPPSRGSVPVWEERGCGLTSGRGVIERSKVRGRWVLGKGGERLRPVIRMV